jgi:hypothetical protein
MLMVRVVQVAGRAGVVVARLVALQAARAFFHTPTVLAERLGQGAEIGSFLAFQTINASGLGLRAPSSYLHKRNLGMSLPGSTVRYELMPRHPREEA